MTAWTDLTEGFCPDGVWDDTLVWQDEEIWDESPQWTILKTADPTDEV